MRKGNFQRRALSPRGRIDSDRERLDAFRVALGAPERALQQGVEEGGEVGHWHLEGRSGHVVVAPGGSFWILMHSRSPMTVAWAAATIGAFAVIRRRGAHSLLAEMSWLPDAEEAGVLRQTLAIPIVRAVWSTPLRPGRAA